MKKVLTAHSAWDDYKQLVAIETGDAVLFKEAFQFEGGHGYNPNVECFAEKFLSAKLPDDFQHLWVDFAEFQFNQPRNAVNPMFFKLKKLVAKKLGKNDLVARYATSLDLFSKTKLLFHQPDIELPND